MMKNKVNKKTRQTKGKIQTRKNKGITLIALVITIIVLLILAGVTIATLTGENGILTRATDAREETRYATIKEEKDLWELNKLADEQTGSNSAEEKEDIINRLWENGTITDEEREKLLAGESITVADKKISFGATLVELFENAQADNCIGGSACTQTAERKHLHIGDYINYKPADESATTGPLSEEETGYTGGGDYSAYQSYTVSEDTRWRVLGLNEAEDQILITTESPIKKDEQTAER